MKQAEFPSDNNRRTGEQRLWLNVILQAITDATRRLNRPTNDNLNSRLDVLRAREWFTVPSKDFDAVCELADLNPEAVRAFAERQIKLADQEVWQGFRIRRDVKGKLLKPEAAPGVVSDFDQGQGPGPGSSAREREKLEFL
jgi:hypothetical protein